MVMVQGKLGNVINIDFQWITWYMYRGVRIKGSYFLLVTGLVGKKIQLVLKLYNVLLVF